MAKSTSNFSQNFNANSARPSLFWLFFIKIKRMVDPISSKIIKILICSKLFGIDGKIIHEINNILRDHNIEKAAAVRSTGISAKTFMVNIHMQYK